MEARHLILVFPTTDLEAETRLLGPQGFGFPVRREFVTPQGHRSRTFQVGAGLVEVTEQPINPAQGIPMRLVLAVDDVQAWHRHLRSRNLPAGDIAPLDEGRSGFVTRPPAGPPILVRSLAQDEAQPLDITHDSVSPNVLHCQFTWWSQHWQEDYDFLSEKGMGLVTSRGRGSPPGNRIAFFRAAYEGRAVVEIVDGLYDAHPGPGLHWIISLVVDDAAAFHRRLEQRRQPVSGLGRTRWGVPAFSAQTATGPLVFVYQEREGGTPGMVGQPAGLTFE